MATFASSVTFCAAKIDDGGSNVSDIGMSVKSGLLAVVKGDKIRILSLVTFASLKVILRCCDCLSFSNNGSILLIGHKNEVYAYDMTSDRVIMTEYAVIPIEQELAETNEITDIQPHPTDPQSFLVLTDNAIDLITLQNYDGDGNHANVSHSRRRFTGSSSSDDLLSCVAFQSSFKPPSITQLESSGISKLQNTRFFTTGAFDCCTITHVMGTPEDGGSSVRTKLTLNHATLRSEGEAGSATVANPAFVYALISVPPARVYTSAVRSSKSSDGDGKVDVSRWKSALELSSWTRDSLIIAALGDGVLRVMQGGDGRDAGRVLVQQTDAHSGPVTHVCLAEPFAWTSTATAPRDAESSTSTEPCILVTGGKDTSLCGWSLSCKISGEAKTQMSQGKKKGRSSSSAVEVTLQPMWRLKHGSPINAVACIMDPFSQRVTALVGDVANGCITAYKELAHSDGEEEDV